MTTTATRGCDYCGADAELSAYLPAKYATVNYSPDSFSADEVEDVCDRCVRDYRVSHDPAVKRRPRPANAKPYRWL